MRHQQTNVIVVVVTGSGHDPRVHSGPLAPVVGNLTHDLLIVLPLPHFAVDEGETGNGDLLIVAVVAAVLSLSFTCHVQ